MSENEIVKGGTATFEIVKVQMTPAIQGENIIFGVLVVDFKRVDIGETWEFEDPYRVTFESEEKVDGSLPVVTLEDIKHKVEEDVARKKRFVHTWKKMEEFSRRNKDQYSYLVNEKFIVKT